MDLSKDELIQLSINLANKYLAEAEMTQKDDFHSRVGNPTYEHLNELATRLVEVLTQVRNS